MENKPKQYGLGVLLVHGIGTQPCGDTLVRWGDILLKTLCSATRNRVKAQVLAAVAAQMGEPDRAIAALRKLLSIPVLTDTAAPLTPALLRLDPMFDPLRNDPRFQELVAPISAKMRLL